MVEIYYYIVTEKATNSVECGIKLSENYKRTFQQSGSEKKALLAYLNPKDNPDLYNNKEYISLKIQADPSYCYVAESCLYFTGLNNESVMDLYYQSIIPLEQYKFGSYRKPECLVTNTVIGDYISVMNKDIDSPILFDNSEELYMNNRMNEFVERHASFYDDALYSLCSALADYGKMIKHEDPLSQVAVFVDKQTDQTIILKMPDLNKY